jgi:hypothetical protein
MAVPADGKPVGMSGSENNDSPGLVLEFGFSQCVLLAISRHEVFVLKPLLSIHADRASEAEKSQFNGRLEDILKIVVLSKKSNNCGKNVQAGIMIRFIH